MGNWDKCCFQFKICKKICKVNLFQKTHRMNKPSHTLTQKLMWFLSKGWCRRVLSERVRLHEAVTVQTAAETREQSQTRRLLRPSSTDASKQELTTTTNQKHICSAPPAGSWLVVTFASVPKNRKHPLRLKAPDVMPLTVLVPPPPPPWPSAVGMTPVRHALSGDSAVRGQPGGCEADWCVGCEEELSERVTQRCSSQALKNWVMLWTCMWVQAACACELTERIVCWIKCQDLHRFVYLCVQSLSELATDLCVFGSQLASMRWDNNLFRVNLSCCIEYIEWKMDYTSR